MDHLKAKIQNGRIGTVLDELLRDYGNSEYSHTLIILKSRLQSLRRNYNGGEITQNEHETRINRITKGTLEIIDDIKTNSIEKSDSNLQGQFSKRLLFCETNPLAGNLFSNVEIREVEEIIAKFNEKIRLEIKFGMSIVRFIRAIIKSNPDILHFTAFSNEKGVYFNAKSGEASTFIKSDLFEKYLEVVADRIECLFFNTFISEELARRISNEAVFTVGYNEKIESMGAIEFATGFYNAIGFGKDYSEALEVGYKTVSKESYPLAIANLYAYYNGEKIIIGNRDV